MDIIQLAAKDQLVRTYGGLVKHWDDDTWRKMVDSMMAQLVALPHDRLEDLLDTYPDTRQTPKG